MTSQYKRIAFSGDWHGNLPFALDAIDYAAAENAEVIVHAGDYGWLFTERFTKGIERALAKAGLRLFFTEGNHEHYGKLEQLFRSNTALPGIRLDVPERQRFHLPRPGKVSPSVWHLARGTRWEWNGISFMACGGAHSVDRRRRKPGLSWWPQETITDADIDACARRGRTDVLISHDCPAGVDIPGLEVSAYWFDPAEIALSQQHRERLLRVCEATRPGLIVHGHYHTAYTQTVTFGWGDTRVIGLSDDGTGLLTQNTIVLDIGEIRDLALLRPHQPALTE